MGNLKERESRRKASVVGSIIEQQPAEETMQTFRERGELTLPCDAAACFTKPQQGLTEVREYALDDAVKAAEVIAFLMGNKRIGV